MTIVHRLHADGSITKENQVVIHGYQDDQSVTCGNCGSHHVARYRIGRQQWVECWCGARKRESSNHQGASNEQAV